MYADPRCRRAMVPATEMRMLFVEQRLRLYTYCLKAVDIGNKLMERHDPRVSFKQATKFNRKKLEDLNH
jgi:hypothetical protein